MAPWGKKETEHLKKLWDSKDDDSKEDLREKADPLRHDPDYLKKLKAEHSTIFGTHENKNFYQNYRRKAVEYIEDKGLTGARRKFHFRQLHFHFSFCQSHPLAILRNLLFQETASAQRTRKPTKTRLPTKTLPEAPPKWLTRWMTTTTSRV
jgi:hypothetical protein